MHDSKEIGSRLRAERKRFGLTQDDVASAIGVVKRTQANYEAGTSDAPAWYLGKAMQELGFDVVYVLTGKHTAAIETSLNELEISIIGKYRSIPEDDQKTIRRLLDAMAVMEERGLN